MDDPFDNPIWHALTGRQAEFAQGQGPVRRFRPDVSPFAALANGSDTALRAAAELCAAGERLLFIQRAAMAVPPGLHELERGLGVLMVAETFTASDRPDGIVPLGEGDAAAMLALARLTKPGPFRARTHELAPFWGVKDAGGRLLAMAGERLKLPGMSEVSGVCTHPDARGQGFAALLSRHVASEIVRRGEVPFLHAYATNTGAIRLYERLGFRRDRELQVLLVERG